MWWRSGTRRFAAFMWPGTTVSWSSRRGLARSGSWWRISRHGPARSRGSFRRDGLPRSPSIPDVTQPHATRPLRSSPALSAGVCSRGWIGSAGAFGLGLDGDHGHFNAHAGDQVGAHRGAHRLDRARELLLVAGVELGELGEISEMHQARHDVIQRGAGRVQQYFDVAERLRGLLPHVITDQLPGLRIEAALAGQENQVAGPQPRRV